MSHSEHNVTTVSGGRLLITLLLNFLITIAEIIGGLVSGSLALISDALHNFSDGVAIIISYVAIRLNRKPKSPLYTFGLKRAQILAAIINASVLVSISLYLFIESYHRFKNPETIEVGLMMLIAFVGLLANTLGTLLLRSGAKGNMNIRSAYLHLLGDAVSSLGVIIGGAVIYLWGVYWVDPLLTILISLYILIESYKILKEALAIVLMASPANVSIAEINQSLTALESVNNVHHVHLWQMDEHDIHFEAHVDISDRLVSATSSIQQQIVEILRERYAINHVTLQFECQACDTTLLIHE